MIAVIKTITGYIGEDIKRIPILRSLLPFVAGILVSRSVETSFYYIAVGALVLAAMSLLLGTTREGSKRVAMWCNVVISLASLLFGMAYSQLRTTEPINEKGSGRIVGYVSEMIRDVDGETRMYVHADSLIVGHTLYKGVDGMVMNCPEATSVSVGREISGEVKLWSTDHRHFSSFDYEPWMLEKNISFVCSADTISLGDNEVWTLSTAVSKLRVFVAMRLVESGMNDTNVRLVMALLMGDRSKLDEKLRMAFADCGIMHILAVSGLHVGLIYGILLIMFGGLRRKNPWLSTLFVVALLWCYALTCGMAPSVFRATIMMTLIEIGRVTGKTYDVGNSLCIAIFVILLVNPMNIYSLGLYLSVMAVWGITRFYVPIKARIGKVRGGMLGEYLVGSSLMSLVAQVTTMPVSLYYFHRFPVYFLIHNVVLIWLVAPVVGLSILSVIVGPFIPFGGLVDIVLTYFCRYVEWAASWPHSVIENIPFGGLECFCVILLLYVLSWAISEKWTYWKVETLWLTIVTATFVAISSFFVAGIIQNRTQAVVAYDVYGSPTLHVVSNRHGIHILSDTTSGTMIRLSEEIDAHYNCLSSETRLMMDGMRITTPMGEIVIVDSSDRVDSRIAEEADVVMITGDASPFDGKYSRALLSTHSIMTPDWKESEFAGRCFFLSDEPYIDENKGW